MYLAPQSQLDGFNPLKAIGRALGSTGRAIVGAVVPGGNIVSKVLDTAARAPAGSKDATAQAINAAAAAMPTVPAPVASTAAPVSTTQPLAPSATDELTKAALLKFITSQPVAAPQAQPVMTPASPSVVISSPSAPSAPAASALPSWAIPAMIGGMALVLVMSQKR